jgi:hypothetical protein
MDKLRRWWKEIDGFVRFYTTPRRVHAQNVLRTLEQTVVRDINEGHPRILGIAFNQTIVFTSVRESQLITERLLNKMKIKVQGEK